ncbi:ApbE family lipoprotein [Neobacillus bataviensis LMG 21833]|uniref:FAD:protein FMN transferase n=1 Tax=Neobacillus bataviensis LMG 21833 TaxID=1117379 RepID=K6DD82_9BACI|nr:FAD:protein FMN transferase [Neobacillus bataviensis]EKN65998.1 ApbE family lipoprotein [Neobacillus bataviensis LMG 21833]
MFQYQFNSMSTMVQISINHELFANDMMPIYKLFELVENTCSRFRSDSELSILNRQVGKVVTISSELFLILTEANRFYKDTGGIFNTSILTALENSGYAKSIEFIRDRELERPAHSTAAAVRSQPYTINEERQTVILHSKIDLGGIAKGWVIDRASQLLAKIGYGFINVGGDIRIFGELPRPLNIGIENPLESLNMISSIQIENGAVATSTSMKRKWLVNGEWRHHLINTRTGRPSESGIVSATVTAPTALEADVWAKTVLLLGEKAGREWCAKKCIRAVLINKDGEIWRGGE